MTGQNTSSAVMQQRSEPHDSLDDFPTPPWATRAMVEYVLRPRITVPLDCLIATDPNCNRGYMAKPLAESFQAVITADIFDYGWSGQHFVQDYLFPGLMFAANITCMNPPFRLAEQMILRSFETPGWIGTVVIVRSAFLEGIDRYEILFSTKPPTIQAQFVERVVMHQGVLRDPNKKYWNPEATAPDGSQGAFVFPKSATAYSCLAWLRDLPREPTIWIPPCRMRLERPGDYPDVPQPAIDLPVFIASPDRSIRLAVSNKPGEAESAIPDGAQPNSNPGCAPSFSDDPELPEFLRRKRDAA